MFVGGGREDWVGRNDHRIHSWRRWEPRFESVGQRLGLGKRDYLLEKRAKARLVVGERRGLEIWRQRRGALSRWLLSSQKSGSPGHLLIEQDGEDGEGRKVKRSGAAPKFCHPLWNGQEGSCMGHCRMQREFPRKLATF